MLSNTPAAELGKISTVLDQAWEQQKTSAAPISSGNVEQILNRSGISALAATQCALVLEALEETNLPTDPQTIIACLRESLENESLEANTKASLVKAKSTDTSNHPDPFFSAVNYNRKRYAITATNHNCHPPVVFQDWRNADECRSGQYEISEAWDSQACNFLSPIEIKNLLYST